VVGGEPQMVDRGRARYGITGPMGLSSGPPSVPPAQQAGRVLLPALTQWQRDNANRQGITPLTPVEPQQRPEIRLPDIGGVLAGALTALGQQTGLLGGGAMEFRPTPVRMQGVPPITGGPLAPTAVSMLPPPPTQMTDRTAASVGPPPPLPYNPRQHYGGY